MVPAATHSTSAARAPRRGRAEYGCRGLMWASWDEGRSAGVVVVGDADHTPGRRPRALQSPAPMFTGIVEETGTVRSAEAGGEVLRVSIAAAEVLRGLGPGGSIAVNGC